MLQQRVLLADIMPRAGSQTQRPHVYEMASKGKSIATERSLVVVRGWGRGEWGVAGHKVALWGDGKVLELDFGDGCTAS